jgi:hypothetical protein
MRSVGLRQSFAHRVPVVQRPRTPPFHGDDTGSNPVGDANSFSRENNDGFPASFPAASSTPAFAWRAPFQKTESATIFGDPAIPFTTSVLSTTSKS